MASRQPDFELMRRAHHLYHVEKMSIRAIAHELGLYRDGKPRFGKVQRMITDYGKRYRVMDELLQRAEKAEARVIQLETEADSLYEPSERDDTDWEIWEAYLDRFEGLGRMVIVQTLFDMHLPDDDPQAVALALRINRMVKPDVTILGSDSFDLDVLSLKYPRMYNRKRRDPFEEVRPRYDAIVDELVSGNPHGALIAIGDNHGQQRLENWINNTAPIFGDRLTAAYNELIRSRGRVMWLGWTQELFLNQSVFEHGKKSGANPALANFKARGASMPVLAGHNHRWQQIVEVKQRPMLGGRGMLYYPLISAVTGCLQRIPPHYVTDTKAANWTQGCAIIHVNMHGMDTHVQNILFHPRLDGSLVAVFGSEELIQPAVAAAERKSA